MSLADELLNLQSLTERLRRDCPWDREQTERTIVPHTVEEAYEVADAAIEHDDAKLADELGDLLFQVYFLSLLLQERGSAKPTRGRPDACASAGRRSSARTRSARGSSTTSRSRFRRSSTRARCSGARPRSGSSIRTQPAR